MGRKNIMSVLEKLMNQAHFHCAWQLNWLEESRAVRLNLQIPLNNEQGITLLNNKGQETDTEALLYETCVLFYDDHLYSLESTHFLKTIPVNQMIGIEYGELLATTMYLKRLMNKTPLYFQEFLADTNRDIFELNFQESEYQMIRERIIDQHRYSQERVFLPK
ncbi:DUF3013 family protein [Aerococcaceae bacterium DSM 111176]|nr:DUF3013 family protein [Aerococcaceae bacterium DSM 111176]